jgi:DNA-binding NarL/FixJ family response regulator
MGHHSLDYSLPKLNAPSAIAVLKKAKIDIPIIIISGTIDEKTAIECTRLGAQDYFMKGKLSRLCPACFFTPKLIFYAYFCL